MVALPVRKDFTSVPVSIKPGLERLADFIIVARPPVFRGDLARALWLWLPLKHSGREFALSACRQSALRHE